MMKRIIILLTFLSIYKAQFAYGINISDELIDTAKRCTLNILGTYTNEVELGKVRGSGGVVNFEADKYLITAFHVIDDGHGINLSYIFDAGRTAIEGLTYIAGNKNKFEDWAIYRLEDEKEIFNDCFQLVSEKFNLNSLETAFCSHYGNQSKIDKHVDSVSFNDVSIFGSSPSRGTLVVTDEKELSFAESIEGNPIIRKEPIAHGASGAPVFMNNKEMIGIVIRKPKDEPHVVVRPLNRTIIESILKEDRLTMSKLPFEVEDKNLGYIGEIGQAPHITSVTALCSGFKLGDIILGIGKLYVIGKYGKDMFIQDVESLYENQDIPFIVMRKKYGLFSSKWELVTIKFRYSSDESQGVCFINASTNDS